MPLPALIARHDARCATDWERTVNARMIAKVVGIGVLAGALLIPVAMIRDLVGERQMRSNTVATDIANGWGGHQSVAGPWLRVAYERHWTETSQDVVNDKAVERRRERVETGVLRIPVDEVAWTMDVTASEKARGIFKARLYAAQISVSGIVTIPARFGIDDAKSRYQFSKPHLTVGVADPKGLRSASLLEFGTQRVAFLPGLGDTIDATGIHAPLDLAVASEARTLPFQFSLELAGSEALAFAPVARDASVAMRANWAHPSFFGPFLPAKHAIDDAGFTAEWKISRYASTGADRLASCQRDKACDALGREKFGVSFIEPVGVYQQLDRASKYGFLFVGLLFAAFGLFELLKRLAIHPIQYALVGLALAMFFLLLTALSEHLGFAKAYAFATLACVGLVTVYVVRVLRSIIAGTAFGAGLLALYGALFLLLRAEDYALIAGALLVFAILAAVMVGTRRIDWYQLTAGEKKAPDATH